MPVRRFLWRTVGALLTAVAAVGCATSTAQMTPQQREGVELRRYCEQNPEDVVRCLGFLGFR
jgi:hypothetical protein